MVASGWILALTCRFGVWVGRCDALPYGRPVREFAVRSRQNRGSLCVYKKMQF